MFTDENNGGQGAPAPSQEQGTSPYDVFNDPIPVTSDDGDDIYVSGDPFQSNFGKTPEQQTPPPVAQQLEQGQQPEAGQNAQAQNQELDIDFEDELTKNVNPSQPQNQENEEDLIKKLQEKGYKIEKEGATSENKEEALEMERIDGLLNQANQFISQPDNVVVKEKLRSDLAKQYSQRGKQHLVGSEEFEIELEGEYSEYENNPAMTKLFADNVRRDVKEVISQNEQQKNQIVAKREQAEQQKVAENRINLQNGIKAIASSNEGFLGVKITPEVSKKIYNSVISGEFAKTVNSDPNLVAEFATYIEHREEIRKKLGGPSYGEGVKAAVDALLGNNKDARTTPLTQAMTSSSNGQGGAVNRKSSWGIDTVKVEGDKKDEKAKVAGSGLSFL